MRLAVACLAVLVAAAVPVSRLARAEATTGEQAPALQELSGAVTSADGAFLWTIEDSGNPALIRATGFDGAALGEWPIAGGENIDWEDLAVAHAGESGRSLLIGDIGDNGGDRPAISLYLVAEPTIDTAGEPVPATRMDLLYPDGPRDAEAMLVHPDTWETLIVTKRQWGAAGVYRVVWGEFPTLERIAAINGAGIGPFGQITGGAVSPDGLHAALLTYSAIQEWDLLPGETLADALQHEPRRLSRPTIGQTEAIAYSADGSILYVGAEGNPSQIAAVPLDPAR